MLVVGNDSIVSMLSYIRLLPPVTGSVPVNIPRGPIHMAVTATEPNAEAISIVQVSVRLVVAKYRPLGPETFTAGEGTVVEGEK